MGAAAAQPLPADAGASPSTRRNRSRGRGASTPGFSGSSSDDGNRLGALRLERAEWREPESREPIPAAGRPELLEDYEPPAREPIEWTPDRAGAIVRGAGFTLHKIDGLHLEPGGEELWRATAEDAEAIGAPLSRILNRYAPARELAGYADEAELTLALVAYTRDNLALRGRLVKQRRDRGERPEWGPEAATAAGGRPPEPDEPGGYDGAGGIGGTFGHG